MPQIQVWINNDDSANVEKLVKTLNDTMLSHKDKRLKAFFIFVDDNGKSIEPKLASLAGKTKSDAVCLAYLSAKNRGVRAYKINTDPSIKNTFMLYRDRTITSNLVNVVADEKGLKALKNAIADLVK